MFHAFQINPADNVATLLEDAEGVVEVLGSKPRQIALTEPIAASHKVALTDIAAAQPVIKFGVRHSGTPTDTRYE